MGQRNAPERLSEWGLTIHVTDDGRHLHHIASQNHLGLGGVDVRYLITDGPERVGAQGFAESVHSLVDDNGVEWLAGRRGRDPNPPHKVVPVCWRRRKGESWSMYS